MKKLSHLSDYLDFTPPSKGCYHSYYTFPVLIKKPNKLNRLHMVNYLEDNGIETRPLFAGCLPDQPAFRKSKGRKVGNLKNSRYARDNVFFFGIHPGIGISDLNYICKVISNYMDKHVI